MDFCKKIQVFLREGKLFHAVVKQLLKPSVYSWINS